MSSLHLWTRKVGWNSLFLLSAAQGRLQAAGTQLHDVQAKKNQLAAQIREAQAMLAMNTSMWLLSALACHSSVFSSALREQTHLHLMNPCCGQCVRRGSRAKEHSGLVPLTRGTGHKSAGQW